MNRSREKLILLEQDMEAEIRRFTGLLTIYPRTYRREILKALHWSRTLHEGQKRSSGEPYIVHPLKVAEILIDLKMDPPTIVGALLHDVLEDTNTNREELVEHFGEHVASLVDGVTHIDDIDLERGTRNAISLRKMIWAMVNDLRVIFIKLADKRHNMNTLEFIPEKHRRLRIARECLEIFAPMAGKLGMSALKSELEDLSFKVINSFQYMRIREHVVLRREERKLHLEEVKAHLLHEAARERLKVEISARAKHFYSVYQKMKLRNKSLEDIYDLMGLRIICGTESDCYVILGLVHRLWTPVEGRFKDYIAQPKGNGYQSLHTAVVTGKGHPLEIQIRTKSMHATAEFGIAAHWAYKERKAAENIRPEELNVVRYLQTLRKEGFDEDANEFLSTIKQDLLGDSIVVYTPKGDPVELPENSTAIDFAYHIHSEIGTHCSGAKANGIIIPLVRPLKNTQTIQILTSSHARPHQNWLRHVQTARARSKIRAWLNKYDSNLIIDRNIIIKKESPRQQKPDAAIPKVNKRATRTYDTSRTTVSVGKEQNMLISFGQCCAPAPGDPIVGYISRGRGVIVHKPSCPNLKGIPGFDSRRIHVEWETQRAHCVQKFTIRAHTTSNLFSEIEGAIRKSRGHLIAGNLDENERGDYDGHFTVEMLNPGDFKNISKCIRAIPAVLGIARD